MRFCQAKESRGLFIRNTKMMMPRIVKVLKRDRDDNPARIIVAYENSKHKIKFAKRVVYKEYVPFPKEYASFYPPTSYVYYIMIDGQRIDMFAD